MRKKYLVYGLLFLFFLLVAFELYCFLPLLADKQKNPERIFLLDRNGEVITNIAGEYGYAFEASYDLESEFVKNLLFVEDEHFYSHFGVDILSKLGALKNNLASASISGASTITEQYIKNKYFPEAKRSYLQKAREANIAFFYSLFSDKNEVLTDYLNTVYMGNTIYGVGTAMEVYFGKSSLDELTQEEQVMLVSLIHRPSTTKLRDTRFSNYFQKVQKRLGYDFDRRIFSLPEVPRIDRFPFVTRYATQKTKEGSVSIDAKLQQELETVLNETLNRFQDKNITNGAILAFDPKTMEVLVYIGSRDFASETIDGEVDIIKAPRQPGSTFKPFLYLLALREGAGAHSLLLDVESQYNSFQKGKTYSSENYSLKEYGLIELKRALGNSLNNASVRLTKEIGLQKTFSFYKHFGFQFLHDSPEYYGYGFVLGSPTLSLESMLLAYMNLLPHFKIDTTRELQFLYEADREQLKNNYKKQIQTVDPEKFLLYEILKNPDNRDISFGVNSLLNTSIPQAVKTGTSSNFRDNLVISYHPDLVVGVWVGNNDNSPMKGVTGISGAGYIWNQVIEKAINYGYIQDQTIPVPAGIEKLNYVLDSAGNRVKTDYDMRDKRYYSRLLDGVYDRRDIAVSLSGEEEEKLKDLGIYLQP